MDITILSQLAVAVTVITVWTYRYDRETAWRGGDARSMKEEFDVYGLPAWVLSLTRVTKLSLAALLIVGVWMSEAAALGAAGMAAMMAVAVAMHVKVGDSARKSVPAFLMLVLCVVVLYGQMGEVETVVSLAGE